MKKILMITAVLLCAVSCSEKPQTENIPVDTQQTYSAEKLTGIAYRKESVKLPDDMNQIYCFKPYNAGNNYFILGAGLTIPEFWTADKSFQNFEKIEIPEFDTGISYNIDVAEDGTVVEFLLTEKGFEIHTFSSDGKLLTSSMAGDFPELPDESTIIDDMASDGNIIIASINGTYYIFKTDGTYIGELSADAVGHNRDGSLVCAVTGDSMQICPITPDGKIENSSVTYDFGESIQDNIISGTGDYDMFIRSRSTIYGIRSDNSAIEALFSINYSGLGSDNIQGFVMGNDGRFSVIENSYSDFNVKFRTYTQCTKEEYESIPHITVGAAYEDLQLKEYISTFNDTHDDLQVDMKIYENDYSGETENLIGNETFAKDMLAGNIPDVLLMEDMSGNFRTVNLYKQGALCDLYSFIDNDENISREDFIPSLLNALEIDGGIYVLPNTFSLQLKYTAKEKFVGDIETWDFNAYMDLIENLPENMGIFNRKEDYNKDTKYARRMSYSWDKWADFENNTCDFNNDEFIRYLNYCNGADIIDAEIDPELFDSWTDEDHNLNFKNQQRQYRDDLALFNDAYVSSYYSYLYLTKGEFGGEPIITLGEIGSNNAPVTFEFGGTNGYAITSTSDKQELAWKFLSSMVSDEFYSESKFSSFPVTESGLEILARYEQQPQNNQYSKGFEDYTGYLYPYGDGDNYSELGYIDDNIISEVNSLIEKAVPEKSGIYPPEDFYNIAYEEFDRFFNGETTAQQCAENMQNRLSIYLSENE